MGHLVRPVIWKSFGPEPLKMPLGLPEKRPKPKLSLFCCVVAYALRAPLPLLHSSADATMSSVSVRLKYKTLNPNLRLFSSSSSSSPLPPPTSSNEEPQNNNNNNTSAYFRNIKSSLRQVSPTERRIPLNPPKPDIFSTPNTQRPTYLDEIRSKLGEFRLRSAPPSSPTSSSPVSFQDLYKSKVVDKSTGGGSDDNRPPTLSYKAISESLRQNRVSNPAAQQPKDSSFSGRFHTPSPISLKNVRERMNRFPGDSSDLPLPRSIFGRELDKKAELEKEGISVTKQRRTDFVKQYGYDELGEKLRMLRPETGLKDKNKKVSSGFSLEELVNRLAKLRETEERRTDSTYGSVSFMDLRDSLETLRDSMNTKKEPTNRLSILAHIGGFGPPEYMLNPPQERLIEKYFRPELISSQEKMKLELEKVRNEFKMSESDCGSARVQVAQLTTKIKHLSAVLHKKDKHSQKGLQAMVQRRKKLLKYLRRTDWDSYSFVLSKLRLRDAPEYRA